MCVLLSSGPPSSAILASAATSAIDRLDATRSFMSATVDSAGAFDFARSGHLRPVRDSQLWLSAWSFEHVRTCGMNGRGRPRRKVELAEDVRDMAVDGVLAHHEPLGDLSVRQPLRQQAQDITLTGRELGKRRAATTARRLVDEAPRSLGLHRPEPEQALQRVCRLELGRLEKTERDEARGELDPRLSGLERRTALFEAIHRILEQRPSALVGAACGGQHALGQIGAGPQRRSADQLVDFSQLLKSRSRLIQLTARDSCADEKLEGGCAIELSVRWYVAQQPREALDGAKRLAPIEHQASATELHSLRGAGLVEEKRSFIWPALPSSELRQHRQGCPGPQRARAREVVQRSLQQRLVIRPPASPQVHSAVLCPAKGEHVAAAKALRKLGDSIAPCGRSLEVAHGRARGDQEAAGPGTGNRDRGLSLQRRRRGLVEVTHALE